MEDKQVHAVLKDLRDKALTDVQMYRTLIEHESDAEEISRLSEKLAVRITEAEALAIAVTKF